MLQYLTALFYFDGETAVAACVLRATTKKGCQLFLGKKCIRVIWLEDFLTSK